MAETAEQARAAVDTIMAVAVAIRDLGSVPSGHLYARLMGRLELQQFQQIIAILKRTGAVTEANHVLTWAGGK